ncbi:putative WRKY transcription factor 46 [Raphanus sativus]|nr:putative WRKY transcription factor 46 [Raphanus sativus]
MVMEEKLVINELEQGRELAKRLMSNLKDTSSAESNRNLISEILSIYQNAISRLSATEEDDNNILKRSREIDNKDSKEVFKKRKISEKKTEKVSFFVGGAGQEKGSIDDGYCWRKYGQKEIHGSINPRGYFRCTHRFTQNCLAVKQVQKSDTDPSIFEVKYVGNHTCNNTTTSSPKTPITTNFSVSMCEGGNRVDIVTEKQEDIIKPTKTEEATMMMSLADLESKKNIFRTFSFCNYEFENAAGGGWKGNIFEENQLSPATTSGSGITSEIVTGPAASVENSETADSYFSSLDNIIDFGQDWLWSF